VVSVRSFAHKYQSIDFNFLFEFLCVDGCREKSVSFLSHRIKRLDGSWFKLLSRGDFLNVVLLASFRVSTVISNQVSRTNSFAIVVRS
jgi:hypothetical protein